MTIVLCICGIPGSGKSYLTELICKNLQGTIRISYDAFEVDRKCWDSESFQQSRRRAFNAYVESLEFCPSSIIIVDDIMHLRSMRKEIYSAALSKLIPTLMVWVKCDALIALTRNETRLVNKVDKESISNIISTFEPPSQSHVSDRWNLSIDGDGSMSDLDMLLRINKKIAEIHSAPPIQLRATPECADDAELSNVHTADLDIRNMTSKIMKLCSTRIESVMTKQRLAKVLSDAKSNTLQECKQLEIKFHEMSSDDCLEYCRSLFMTAVDVRCRDFISYDLLSEIMDTVAQDC